MTWTQYFELFTLITGIIYLLLEIKQSNYMWILGIFTALSAVIVFAYQRLYASMGLNIYYVIISVIGFFQWKKDSALAAEAIEDKPVDSENVIHLNRLSLSAILYSSVILIVATVALSYLLKSLGDSSSLLDSFVTVLSAIATYWLTKSYKEQWLLWIVADLLTTALCLQQNISWMALLYFLYALSAIYGYIHWKKRGIIVSG